MNQRPKYKRWSIEEIKSTVVVVAFGYECISDIYINSKSKLEFLCDKNHEFKMKWGNFYSTGQRCPLCLDRKNGRRSKWTIKKIRSTTEIIATNYKCISNKYKDISTKLDFICDKYHKFRTCWDSFHTKSSRCPICYIKRIKEDTSVWTSYKGGVSRKGLPLYDTYAPQIDWCEEVKRDPEYPRFLNVRCTESSCRKWFMPTTNEIYHRIGSFDNKRKGESRFYCSKKCKQTCSIYNQKLYPKGFKTRNGRDSEVQAELRDMVLKRDGYICLKCGSKEDLIAHHIESLNCNPLMSADVDNCMTVCESCHDEIHKEEGCRYVDLRKDNLC